MVSLKAKVYCSITDKKFTTSLFSLLQQEGKIHTSNIVIMRLPYNCTCIPIERGTNKSCFLSKKFLICNAPLMRLHRTLHGTGK